MEQLRVTEIYASIQGESSYSGIPCTFVRLTGCPLRCRWCDTAYGFEGGKDYSIDEILKTVKDLGVPLVELTGGEPLAQSETPILIQKLFAAGYQVLIETGGSEDISCLPQKTHIVMDLKCPDSGMEDRNLWSNLESLKPSDEIKFVVASRKDYEWTRKVIEEHDLSKRFKVLLSTAFGLITPLEVVDWMMADKLDVRFQLQMHKYIWSPRKKGV
jgi:7-carboxy-7-deazaguanine synthase